MAASIRSHFRHTPQQDDAASTVQRKQSSRIPTKSTNDDEGRSKAAQHVSKLAKRASRSIRSSDKSEHGTQSSGRLPTPVATAQDPSGASRRTPAVPPSEVSHRGLGFPMPPKHRHNPLPAPPTIRTPSLVSGSSASTFDSPRSNGLRRKPSTIERYVDQKRADTAPAELDRATMHSRNDGYQEALDDSVFGFALPPSSDYPRSTKSDHAREWNVTRDITPPVFGHASSATPSTRYTESPFSHVPTPSSASSYSPAVVPTTGPLATPRPRLQSPTRSRPPTTSRQDHKNDSSRLGLPSVRESSTSSSNSTVKQSDYKTVPARKEVPRKTPTAPPATNTSSNSKGLPRLKSSAQAPSRVVQKSVASKLQVQIPPELAHLNVDLPVRADKPLPPLRPSRDDIPSIADMTRASPVVQSDLPHLYTTYHKRTPSLETPISPSAPSPSFKTRFGLSSRSSSKQASPRVDSAISPPPSARNFARGPTPDVPPAESRQRLRKDSPAIGPAPSPSKSPRFGIFSRKPKPDVAKVAEKPKRQPVKGPAAGTGHEGYGRFGFRGRSGSSTSSAGFRSPSADSSTSSVPRPPTSRKDSVGSSRDGSELDDFLRDRLTPVILRGSGSTMSNAPSVSDAAPSSIIAPSSSSSLDSYPTPQLLPSAMQGDPGKTPAKRPSVGRRMPSDSSEDDVAARYPTLLGRAGSTRVPQTEKRQMTRAPPPIITSMPPRRQPIDSCDTETSAWPQTDSSLPATEELINGREGDFLRSPLREAVAKPTRKWNFFQRAQASPRPKGKQRAVERPETPVQNTAHRNAAHYAIFDPIEPVDLYEVEQIMQENETSAEESMSEVQSPPRMVPYDRRHASLLPSPPKAELGRDADFKAKPTLPRIMVRQDSSESPELLRAQAAVPQPLAHVVDIPRSPSITQRPQSVAKAPQVIVTPEMPQGSFNPSAIDGGEESPKQPRLSPVGRIPRVVSKRDRDRKLPDNSFSRPFARTQPHPSVKPPGTLYNQIRASRELTSPVEAGSQPVSSTSTKSDAPSTGPKSSINTIAPSNSTNRTSMDGHAGHEFIAFTPRKNSEVSYSSSSGNGSWLAALTATAPQVDDPWAEYNDLLDDMMPLKTPISAGLSLGAPFQYASALYDPHSPSVPPALYFSPPPSTQLPLPPRSNTVPAVLSVPQQISRFMQPSLSPLTPHTLSDFVDQYADRNSSALPTPNRTSLPQPARSGGVITQPSRASMPPPRGSMSSSRHSRTSGHSRSASLPEANARNSRSSLTPSARFHRDTQLLDIAEDEGDAQASNANLRFGALMTSKWLSFGRVLFSPAHNEIRLTDEPRVLVLDGLGSDWSYYVALSYPTATVYNLGPAAVNGSTSWPGINQRPPPNHRHIPHSSISAAFPFPKGFFTAVVLRFPIVTTDEAYHACIFECKRVLRPGGHLEVAVLDLDLTNMGSRARHLVRDLKTRLQQDDCNVSLRNLSDVLLRFIGRRGFEGVQRCVVGVPAAGRIPRSQDISSISSGSSEHTQSRTRTRRHSVEKEFSFADLLEDARSNQTETGKSNDEGITKMVAKVGRWWYSTCYESPLAGKSIWDDHALLRECEKQGTSFRLLICFAQKPTQARRRTVSV